jgi:hypothetical protein
MLYNTFNKLCILITICVLQFSTLLLSGKKGGIRRSPKHAEALGGDLPPCLGGRRFLGGQRRLAGQWGGLREEQEDGSTSCRSCGEEEWWTAARGEKQEVGRGRSNRRPPPSPLPRRPPSPLRCRRHWRGLGLNSGELTRV